MGQSISSLFRDFFVRPTVQVLMIGLDNAGKTSILYRLKLGEVVKTVPTIGFNVETVQFKKLALSVWDVGGQDSIRPLWRHYFPGTRGVIFVIDSADPERVEEARRELLQMLDEPALYHAKVLIFANKQDLPNAMRPAEIANRLDLQHLLKHRQWFLQSCSATTESGLYEGLDWLAVQLRVRP